MSTTKWTDPNTEIEYKIGTIGIESFKPKGFFDFFQNIPGYLSMIGGIIIPTYGLWAGPGYAGGTRPVSNPEIKWEQPPCMNDSITKSGANPDQCYSLVDAITKTHDFLYTEAEEVENSGDKAMAKQLKITADLIMFNDIITALKTGVYSCPSLSFTSGSTVYTLQQHVYTQIKEEGETSYFDSTEIEYTKMLAFAFGIKLKYLDGASDAQVAEAYSYVEQIKQLIGVNVTVADPDDPTKTINIKEQANGIIYETSEGATKFAWVIDYNAQKTYEMGKVDGSIATEDTFVYNGNGHITINGGAGNDKIYTGENEDDATYYEINGGAGYDTYYLTDGDSFKLIDSGENRIYKKNASGGWMIAGNFFKDTTNDIWYSADASMHLTHSSPWTLTFADGSTIVFNETFQTGDFGINLITLPDVISELPELELSNTITGDLKPIDADPEEEGVQYSYDEWGNVITFISIRKKVSGFYERELGRAA